MKFNEIIWNDYWIKNRERKGKSIFLENINV